MTGQRHTAARAVEVGLLNRVVRRDQLDVAVDELIGDLLRCGPNAVAAAKRMVFDIPGRDRTEAFADMSELSQALFRSEEAAAGIAAFNARTPPPWAPQDDAR